jgi:hypothetical protein
MYNLGGSYRERISIFHVLDLLYFRITNPRLLVQLTYIR